MNKRKEGEITHAKIEQALGKAMLDPEFQEKLFSNPEKVGNHLGLNESCIELIRKIDPATFAEFTRNLDDRLKKNAALVIFCY